MQNEENFKEVDFEILFFNLENFFDNKLGGERF